jgi:predicted RNA binding protein YcfA (HicA-like mRNA interferase family)
LRLPRDLSGRDLIKFLRRYGYEVTRQVGSHIRLRSDSRGSPHYVTVPDHDNVRVGTLNSILADVADYFELDRSELIKELLDK